MTTTYTTLDAKWRAAFLDGSALVRDNMGTGYHHALPYLGEGTDYRKALARAGVELVSVRASDDLNEIDADLLAEKGYGLGGYDLTRWNPTYPEGKGWQLVAIIDTEDDVCAWFAREMQPA